MGVRAGLMWLRIWSGGGYCETSMKGGEILDKLNNY
jgi:hypothetical protein